MLDPLTLDQLRVLVAVVETGSFSGAARRLRRVQSAVSHAMTNLEAHLGLALWDRSTRVATLTPHGRAVLAAAQRVLAEAAALRELARNLGGGCEPSVSLCVDAFFPTSVLVEVCRSFARAFPAVALRVDTESMSAVGRRVLAGSSSLGVVGPMGILPGLEQSHLTTVELLPVAAREHPLAGYRGRLSSSALREHVQIVLAERGDTASPDQRVLSTRTFRVADLSTKRELLLGGLGWGNLPVHLMRDDLAAGRLVVLRPAAWPEESLRLQLSVVSRPDLAAGPATRWLLGQLGELCVRDLGAPEKKGTPTKARRAPRRPAAAATARRRAPKAS